MTEWLKRLVIAASAFWAGLIAMNFYWYTVWHARSDNDWILPAAMAAIPLMLALAISTMRWPRRRAAA